MEIKNISRQNFIEQDIGQNKAEVLATRYSTAFNLDIAYCADYITDPNDISRIAGNHRHIILIGCCDNNKTRHIMHQAYRKANSGIITTIDSGNEELHGQVVFSTIMFQSEHSQDQYNCPTTSSIKDIVELHNIEANDKLPTEMSCAEHAVSAPQNIMSNITAANIINNICSIILENSSFGLKPFMNNFNNRERQFLKISKCRPIDVNAYYFNVTTGSITCNFIDTDLIINEDAWHKGYPLISSFIKDKKEVFRKYEEYEKRENNPNLAPVLILN